MTLNLGWFSSGRDDTACALLSGVVKKRDEGLLDVSIKFVFCNWEEGEEPEHPEYGQRERFFRLVRELGIPLITLSWKRFREGQKGSKDERKTAYGEKVRSLIEDSPIDLGIWAGYSLWTDKDTCARFNLLNLYPSIPGGPLGTAREVIWQIIVQRAARHGAMVLLCSPEQEEGVPLSCCSFSVQTPDYKPLWEQFDAATRKRGGFETISKEEAEASNLFRRIDRDVKAREAPLLIYTLKMLADGSVKIINGRIHEEDILRKSAYDLTATVDQALAEADPEVR